MENSLGSRSSEHHHGFLMLEQRHVFLNGLIFRAYKDLHKVVGGRLSLQCVSRISKQMH